MTAPAFAHRREILSLTSFCGQRGDSRFQVQAQFRKVRRAFLLAIFTSGQTIGAAACDVPSVTKCAAE